MLSLRQFGSWGVCLGAASIVIALATAARAQNVIIPDTTLGPNESSVVIPIGGGLDTIFGGAIRGQNQFHSFEAFSVGQGNGVVFVTGADAIANILARVTGNNISEIQGFLGTLQFSNGDFGPTDASLFLINPNGIIFGEDAFLGINGSFYATTAEAIELGDQVFSATNPSQSSLLAIDPNTVFINQLTENSGNIESRAGLVASENLTLAANQLTLQDSLTTANNNLTLQTINGLSILNSEVGSLTSTGDLLVRGGDVVIADSTLNVTGIGEAGNELTIQGNNAVSILTSGVVLLNSIGDILIQGKDIFLADSTISADDPNLAGNNLALQANNNVSIANSRLILLDSSGELRVQGRDIVLTDSTLNTFGEGELGNITLIADNLVEFLGIEDATGLLSLVEGPEGQASDITITAAEFRGINNNNQPGDTETFISAFANNGGNSGNITLDVNQSIFLESVRLTSLVTGETTGNAGSIEIRAADLEVLNGSQIQSDVSFRSRPSNNSNTGDIIIDLTGDLRVSGVRQVNDVTFPNFITTSVSNEGQGRTGNLRISADVIDVDDVATISTSSRSSGSAGNVEINANQLTLRNGADIAATSLGAGAAGDIVVNVTGTASFDGIGMVDLEAIANGLPDDAPDFFRDVDAETNTAAGLFTRVLGSGAGGDIQLRANNLKVTNGATISASTSGAGNAGNITLEVADTIQIDGRSDDGLTPSFVDADTESTATGNGGDLRVTANRLEVTGGAQLSSALAGTGEAGDIFVDADTILLQGADADTAASQTSEPRSAITSNIQATGRGVAGDIVITANTLLLVDGGVIDASVLGNGDGGDLSLNIADTVRIAGVAINGLPSVMGSNNEAAVAGTAGDVFLRAGRLELIDGGNISSSSFQTGEAGTIVLDIAGNARFEGVNPIFPERASGVFSRTESDSRGGNLRILAQDLELLNGASLNTTSLARGDSGNIVITLGGLLRGEDGEITTASNETSGGIIDIEAQAIRLFGDSDIRTDVALGAGRGGNITLRADSILVFDDSDILAFSADGEGGNIVLETPVFFGQNFQPTAQVRTRQELANLDGNNRVDVNASGGVASGSISTPDVSNITSSLTELPSTLINAETLIAGSCVAQNNDTEGAFVVTGDNLAQQPGQERSSTYSTGTVQTVNDNTVVLLPQEPEGIYPLADGRLVLSQECQ